MTSRRNSIKRCMECKSKLTETKSIVCGHLVCDYCIKHDNQCLVCPRCNQTTKLEQAKPDISTTKQDEFDSLIDRIEDKIKKIEFDLKNGDYVIKEHFSDLKRQVQLAKEEKIQELNNKAEKLIQDLDKCEKELLEHYSHLEKKNLENKVDELKQNLTKTKANRVQKDLKELQVKVDKEQDEMKCSLFDDLVYRFEICDRTSLGHLVIASSNLIDYEELFDHKKNLAKEFYDVCLKDFDLIQSKQICIKEAAFLANNQLVIGVELFRQHYLFLFNDEFNCIEHRCIDVTPMLTYDNYICITYYIIEGNEEVPYLCLLDNGLFATKKKKKLRDEEYLMGFYKEEIYLYQSNELETFLILNLNFECIGKVGQYSDPEMPFYMHNSPERLLVVEKSNQKFFVYFHRESTTVIDAMTGAKISEIKCKSDNRVDIDLDGNVIIISTDYIRYFNLDGVLIKKIELDNFDFEFDAKQIVFDHEKKFHFYEPDDLYITE